jgi:hypothetical protein
VQDFENMVGMIKDDQTDKQEHKDSSLQALVLKN